MRRLNVLIVWVCVVWLTVVWWAGLLTSLCKVFVTVLMLRRGIRRLLRLLWTTLGAFLTIEVMIGRL